MTWQDPNATPGSGGSGAPGDDASLDETRSDWAPVSPPAAPPPPTGYDALGQPYPAPATGYAPPGMAWAPPPEVVQPASGLRFAEVGPRLAAWIVDSIICGFIGTVLSAPIYLALLGGIDWETFFNRAALGDPFAFGSQFILASFAGSVVSTVILLVYFVFLWSSGGRATLGMRIMRQQIGNAADGRTLSLGQSFKRWLAMGYWVSLLGAVPLLGSISGLAQFVWWIVLLVTTNSSPTRQGGHDKFADTAIVQAGPAPNAWVVGCGALLVAAVVGTVFAFLLASVFVAQLPDFSEFSR